VASQIVIGVGGRHPRRFQRHSPGQ
jgi:hypothetical protein